MIIIFGLENLISLINYLAYDGDKPRLGKVYKIFLFPIYITKIYKSKEVFNLRTIYGKEKS